MSHHFIEDAALVRALRSAVPAGEVRDGAVAAVERWLSRQPRAPRLVGTTVAAKLLGIQAPHVSRLRDQGRMPEPLEVGGSVTVYLQKDVEALAAELARERESRAARAAERSEATA